MTRTPPRRGAHGAPIPPLFDCSPLRVRLTDAGKPFAPKPGTVGAAVTFTHNGREIVGQVWCLAPGGVWAVADHIAYRLGQAGHVMDVRDDRPASGTDVAS